MMGARRWPVFKLIITGMMRCIGKYGTSLRVLFALGILSGQDIDRTVLWYQENDVVAP